MILDSGKSQRNSSLNALTHRAPTTRNQMAANVMPTPLRHFWVDLVFASAKRLLKLHLSSLFPSGITSLTSNL